MAEKYKHVNLAHKYCRDVISGKVLSGSLVKYACQRHLDDLEKEKESSWPYRFDRDKAEKACKFAEVFVHVKGKWAGEKIILAPWQAFIYCCLFGWVFKKNKYRRYIEAYIEVPRKNGKSVLAATIANYMLIADKEPGAEIYSGATTEKQAWEVFRPAKLMIEKTPGIKNYFGLETFAKSVFCALTASRLEPVIGKPGDGASPHCAIVDEYHEHDNSEHYDTMKTGMGARTQPLLLVITTAGVNLAGPCYELHEKVNKILTRKLENERVFGIIYSIDKEDDWQDFNNWLKANPNFGISVNEDSLLHQFETAKQEVSKQNIIRCKHLNQWLSVDCAWMDMQRLEECKDVSLLRSQMQGLDNVIALDLASKLDIAANVQLFWDDDGNYYCFSRYYLPRETVMNSRTVNRQIYQTWEFEEYLTVTEGATIDFSVIEDDVKQDYAQFGTTQVAFDPWQAVQLSQNLDREGLTMVEVGATVSNFSEPMKELQKAIYDGKFHYNGDPILTWMFSNVVAHYDKKENIYPNKMHNDNKIDGVVALIMCMNLAIRIRSMKKPEPEVIVI